MCRHGRWRRFVGEWCFSDQLLRPLFSWRLAVPIACWRSAASEAVAPLGYSLNSCLFSWQAASPAHFSVLFLPTVTYHVLLSFLFSFCLQDFQFACNHMCFIIDCFTFCSCLLDLACNTCCIMTLSISVKLSLMICTNLFKFFDCCFLPNVGAAQAYVPMI